jgi:hypothetical protein
MRAASADGTLSGHDTMITVATMLIMHMPLTPPLALFTWAGLFRVYQKLLIIVL